MAKFKVDFGQIDSIKVWLKDSTSKQVAEKIHNSLDNHERGALLSDLDYLILGLHYSEFLENIILVTEEVKSMSNEEILSECSEQSSHLISIVEYDWFEVSAELFKLNRDNIEHLELSVRSYNVLKRAGVNTISQLKECSHNDLVSMMNMGKKSMMEISAKLLEIS